MQLVLLLHSSQHPDHHFKLVDSGFRHFQTFKCLAGVAGALALRLIIIRYDFSGSECVYEGKSSRLRNH